MTRAAGLGARYESVLAGVVDLLESARRASARSVNTIMTETYWEIGRRIVEHEQKGRRRAGYGTTLIAKLSADLTARFGRGFGPTNLSQMRTFFLAYREILQTESEKSISSRRAIFQTASEKSPRMRFPLPWSHYVKLLSVGDAGAKAFYEEEALRGGWTVRQLERQIGTQFYERTMLSRNKVAMLRRGGEVRPEDAVTADEEVKDPFVLEFLGLEDEYSESDLEAALIAKLEHFLLELGGDFAFIGRQRRLRIGDDWYRVDLVFFHRRLRCLVIVDLKLGRLTHADAGQMHLYLSYATEHWTLPGENPPVGLILCTDKNAAVARYALAGLPNKILAAEYRTALPDEALLASELEASRRAIEARAAARPRRRATPRPRKSRS